MFVLSRARVGAIAARTMQNESRFDRHAAFISNTGIAVGYNTVHAPRQSGAVVQPGKGWCRIAACNACKRHVDTRIDMLTVRSADYMGGFCTQRDEHIP